MALSLIIRILIFRCYNIINFLIIYKFSYIHFYCKIGFQLIFLYYALNEILKVSVSNNLVEHNNSIVMPSHCDQRGRFMEVSLSDKEEGSLKRM